MDLDAIEVRVLGCLIEKRRTTPDVYPLSLNSLRAACNQSTNRDPVVRYEDPEIRDALHRLGRRRWTRLASGARAAKYRHLLGETLGMEADEQSVLAVLALRGPQTLGELRQRTERLHEFRDQAELEAVLERLTGRGMAVRQERRPGQKEERYAHLLSDDLDDVQAPAPAPTAATPAPRPPAVAPEPSAPSDDRLERLERQVAELAEQVAELRAELGVGTTD